jgi:hypothetical protein
MREHPFHLWYYQWGIWWTLATDFQEVCTDKQTKDMDHNSSWEASSSFVSQEIPQNSWIPNVHCCIQKNLLLVPFLIQMNQIFIL